MCLVGWYGSIDVARTSCAAKTLRRVYRRKFLIRKMDNILDLHGY